MSLFFTGSAGSSPSPSLSFPSPSSLFPDLLPSSFPGTGKSVLLREIIQGLRRKFSPQADVVAVTASTGIAACNIGGSTIHSFAGIGLGVETAEELAKKVRKNRKAAQRWARTKVWIIDEGESSALFPCVIRGRVAGREADDRTVTVSMLDGDLFDKLSKVGQIIKKSTEPFGGIQVRLTALLPSLRHSARLLFFETSLCRSLSPETSFRSVRLPLAPLASRFLSPDFRRVPAFCLTASARL